jgi:hypothetical protein
MMREPNEVRETTTRLLSIGKDFDFVDLVREKFSMELDSICKEDQQEQAKVAQSTYGLPKDYDPRTYLMFLLKTKFLSDLGINLYYNQLEVLKVVLFFEHILTTLPSTIADCERKNREVRIAHLQYGLFKGLIRTARLVLAGHATALRDAALEHVKQEVLDADEYGISHNMAAIKLLETRLKPFMSRYVEMLGD